MLFEARSGKKPSICRGERTDPYYNQLVKKATSKEKKILKLARYVNLFYAYRNEMVHGFKEPGHGMEISNDNSNPYYHGYKNGAWELVFPTFFFQLLCTEALNGLKEYLKETDINPYDQYEFGDMWITKTKLIKLMNT